MPLITKADEEMESWEVLRRIIPRGKASVVARMLHVTPGYVNRWCSPPAEDGSDGTGFRSPLDKGADLVDAILLINPLGAGLIPEFLFNHHRQRVSQLACAGFTDSAERRDVSAQMLRQAVEAINALNLEGATDHTLEELVTLGESVRRAIEKVQDEIRTRRINEEP